MKRHLPKILLLLLIVQIGCKSHLQPSTRPGAQWLSWSPTEREKFVWGFIDGYGHGTGQACSAADKLFETNQPHTFGHDNAPSTFPSSRCHASLDEYPNVIHLTSGPDFSPYSSVITEFYSKHTDKRGIPFTQLMEMMSGAKLPSADELYRKFQ